MTIPQFRLDIKGPEGKLPLDKGLLEPIRFMTKRAVPALEDNIFRMDLDGNGDLDVFTLKIVPSEKIDLKCERSACTLFLPDGYKGITKMIPGYDSGDRKTDILIETTGNLQIVLENITGTEVRLEEYGGHLRLVADAVKNGHVKEAFLASIRYNLGLTHTWLVPDAEAQRIKDPLTWISGNPLFTDCVIEFERVLAELIAGGTVEGFKKQLADVQYYDLNGDAQVKERTDFFTAEAVPHLTEMGLINDATISLYEETFHNPPPSFSTKFDKALWYEKFKSGVPDGREYKVEDLNMPYIPFDELAAVDNRGDIIVNPDLYEKLPLISVLVVVNKGRILNGVEIADSHVCFLVKEPDGSAYILHSTPLTDAGIPTVTMETFDSFMRTRYITTKGQKVVSNGRDATAVGVQVLFFTQDLF